MKPFSRKAVINFLFYISFSVYLQYRSDNSRLASCFLECCYDLVLVICSECFHSDPKFYGCISVCAYKLVVIQFDNVTLVLGDDTGYAYEFAWLVRDKDGNGEDSVTLDEAVLYYGGHGDHIHVSAA